MNPVPKNIRVEDKVLLKKVRGLACSACGSKPCDASHIKTRGSGGPDAEWNVVAHCRMCHIKWGSSWSLFLKMFPAFALKLKLMGWTWEDGKLWHPGTYSQQ